jgi:transcriptional regulator GlxA family with amidase domain
MDIAIPIFERFTALDAVGPYEVLSRLPGARVRFVAARLAPVRTETRMLSLNPECTFEQLPSPEIVVVPGGLGTRALTEDERILDWLRHAHTTSTWTTSVCTGSLLLGAAGLLEGLEATTHWSELESLERYGARPVSRRVVEQGKVITAAGVSAGIDMALTLAARIAGEEITKAIQLGIEYDPQPPFHSGSPQRATPETIALVRRAAALEAETADAAAPPVGASD